MSNSRRLQQLAEMQKLRERKCQSAVGDALRDEREKAERVAELRDAHGVAIDHCDAMMRAERLCPDRMLLATGFLAAAQAALETGERAHSEARENESAARRQWHEARHRSDNISSQARSARRKDDRRRDDARQAERLSLRAALSRGIRP